MNPRSVIAAFLPLVAFSLLARLLPDGGIGLAALVAAVAAVGVLATARPFWPPKILAICSLMLFSVLAVASFASGSGTDSWLATWGGAGVGIVLGLLILALVPVMPFTEQYARETTPRAYWRSPTFKQINRVLSTTWGLAMVGVGLSRVVAEAITRNATGRPPGYILLSVVVPIVIIVYMVKFTQSYPDRVTRSGSASPARSHYSPNPPVT